MTRTFMPGTEIGPYVNDLRHVRQLSRDEELRLGAILRDEAAAPGERIEARNRLAESVLPWAVRLAKNHRAARFSPLAEVVSLANVAVLEALNHYDARRSRLTSFVTRKIRWNIARHEFRDREAVRHPVNKRERIFRCRPLADDGRKILDRDPSEWTDPADQRIENENLRRALSFLSRRQRSIVLGRAEGLTLRELGLRYGITKERVRQIETATFRQLRRWLDPGEIRA